MAETHRILNCVGEACIMIYHRVVSCSGPPHFLAKRRPWRTPRWAVANHLESPSTKAYTVADVRKLFVAFSELRVTTQLGCGDLLLIRPSHKYANWVHRVLCVIYPRWFVKLVGNRLGIACLIEATK
jgi:hypothetical protein